MDNTIDLGFYATELELLEKKEKQLALRVSSKMLEAGSALRELLPMIEQQSPAHQLKFKDAAAFMNAAASDVIMVFEQFDRLKIIFADLILELNRAIQDLDQSPSQQA